MSDRTRQEVLVDLVAQYESELAQAWVNGMTLKRMAALRASLDSARTELRALLRADEKAARAVDS
jgi:hypothetical protein